MVRHIFSACCRVSPLIAMHRPLQISFTAAALLSLLSAILSLLAFFRGGQITIGRWVFYAANGQLHVWKYSRPPLDLQVSISLIFAACLLIPVAWLTWKYAVPARRAEAANAPRS